MYYLKTEASFDAAHFLPGYDGKCKNLHGHRWRVEVEVSSDALISQGSKKGMLLDFSDLKAALKEITEPMDHALLLESGSLRENTQNALREEGFRLVELPFRTTAEHFARYFYEQLSEKGLPVHRVNVYETPNNCAGYSREV